MTKEQYIKITEPLRKHPKGAKIAELFNRVLTGAVFLTYPLFLLLLLVQKDPFLSRAIIVPFDSFLVLTFVRALINAQRPYEKFGVTPVFSKDTKGKSFPSRHVFSVFVIAGTVFVKYPTAGAALGIAGAALAFLRVAGGVHEPKDVIFGGLIGAAAGFLGCSI